MTEQADNSAAPIKGIQLSAHDQKFLEDLQVAYPGHALSTLQFAGDGSLDQDKMLEAAEAAHKAQPQPPTGETPNKQNGHTGISEITYPCGCQATGQGNLPEHCPEHPEHKVEVPRDGHGNAFNPDVHAVNRHDGSPKLDSAGKFIGKEHDYPGPPENKFFGS